MGQYQAVKVRSRQSIFKVGKNNVYMLINNPKENKIVTKESHRWGDSWSNILE